MREAEVGLVALFLVDVVGGVVELGLVPARAAIDGGALGERVFVLEGDADLPSTSSASYLAVEST